MKILVCVSIVPDTSSNIKLDGNKVDYSNLTMVMNPWDELALTRAIELKEDESNQIDQLELVSVGLDNIESTLKKAYALGVDKVYRINTEPISSDIVAKQIAEFLRTVEYDILFFGSESWDYNGSVVGAMVSEILKIRYFNSVTKLNVKDSESIILSNYEKYQKTAIVNERFAVSVAKGIASEPRLPNMRSIMMSASKKIEQIPAFNFDTSVELVDYKMVDRNKTCEFIDKNDLDKIIDLIEQNK
ncbi:MAG: hypothetical protein N4A49_04740 [Marinifilaceae bacterium]|jgi:electron transfer flavoprotein beta subunit|nr:hypothetical protein [Marinifilaceae bacterium]